MAEETLPFIALSVADARATAAGVPRSIPQPRGPGAVRQGARLGGSVDGLTPRFEEIAVQLTDIAPISSTEGVLVLETIGDVVTFRNAIRYTPGCEWLLDEQDDPIEPDEDFFFERQPERLIDRKLFLVSTDRETLSRLRDLWRLYINDPGVRFPRGSAPWKTVFSQLKDIRFWSAQDRIEEDVKAYWNDRVLSADELIQFEVELWFRDDHAKSVAIERECRALVEASGGAVLATSRIEAIRYHALLVSLPSEVIQRVLSGDLPLLMRAPSVMFFKPRAEGMSLYATADGDLPAEEIVRPVPERAPVVALLDGLPLQNHRLLADRLSVDSASIDGHEYPAEARVHGTSMASLILHGDLSVDEPTLPSKVFVHPILIPGPGGGESSPPGTLLLDSVHRALRRMFDGEGDEQPLAPSVRIVNLSVCDPGRLFHRRLSPWARLIDWLSYKYGVLFFVSTGNVSQRLTLGLTNAELDVTPPETLRDNGVDWLIESASTRALMSPSEAINAVTVSASYQDGSDYRPPHGRRIIFGEALPSPYGRCGLGFRGAVKPDVLFPGGRVVYSERVGRADESVLLNPLDQHVGSAPGLKCAAPGPQGGDTGVSWVKGTSGATALASRHAAFAFDSITHLGPELPEFEESGVQAAILKSLIVHGASWDSAALILRARLPREHHIKIKRRIAALMGYGTVESGRALGCTPNRATLIYGGTISVGQTQEFRVPLPPSLNAFREWRCLTITLAWIAPLNFERVAYRRAKVAFIPPMEQLVVARQDNDDSIVKKGTVQHEVLSGDQAIAFAEGDELVVLVQCAEDAKPCVEPIAFGLCISIEVEQGVGLPIHQEVSAAVQAVREAGRVRAGT